MNKNIPQTIHKVCGNCNADYYHIPTSDGFCGYCTYEGLTELVDKGLITKVYYSNVIKNYKEQK